ncbi:protoporphyrinogen oxidase [Halorussus marinus]|uniref:protoporphyrinogen oxidase n=1 Tax=Halorussus marinus TaxID=2505976 RepID=UPI001092E69E|nr:protoporphyrinogen oxidase [Halorussus marinus]
MRVGVVGGGVTGLAAHHFLREQGVDSVLFEADDEPGGVIRSRRVDGRVLDLGPQRTRLTPSIAALVESLGLGDELREADDLPLYVYRDGRLRLVPQTPREAVATDLLSWRGKLRALFEPLTTAARPDESVEAYLTRKFGSEVARYYFGPLYGGLYGTHPDEMPMRHSLSRALDSAGIEGSVLTSVAKKVLEGREAPPIASFDGGLQRLPEALYADNDDTAHLNTPVEAIGRAGERFVLETPDGDERFDELVVTTPAGVTAGLVAEFAPEAADALREFTYNPQAVVHLAADADLTGAGYQVQYDEDLRTLGTTWNDSLLDREGVYTCYLGGGYDPEVVEWDDDRLGSVAAREFEAVTGHGARVLSVHRWELGMPAYDRSWAALDRLSTPVGLHLCTNYTARAGIPGRIREAKKIADRLADCAESTATPPRTA